MVGQRIGYIRVSTLDQHTERQLDGIEVDRTFTDKAAGKDQGNRIMILLNLRRWVA
jgi:DNA invertase Pin-like site-specific DNA recombinase